LRLVLLIAVLAVVGCGPPRRSHTRRSSPGSRHQAHPHWHRHPHAGGGHHHHPHVHPHMTPANHHHPY